LIEDEANLRSPGTDSNFQFKNVIPESTWFGGDGK